MASNPPSVVVSGASAGIGLASAQGLAAAGFRVVMLGRDRKRLDEAAKSVNGSIVLQCDVGNADSVSAAIGHIRQLLSGAPDVLVNNAGRFHLAAIEKESADDFTKTLEVNLIGTFRLVQSLLPPMRQRGSGHIITIGSIADHSAFPENAAYAASKFGVRALHGVLREETRGSGIRATLISPGPVDTPLWDSIDPDARPGFTPRAMMLSATAVAEAVVWVATRPGQANVDELRISRS